MNLISLKPEGKVIFVGDTHGDLEASQRVIQKYLKPDTRICFLGDYVDRGPYSKENVEFLWKQREENPQKIYLVKGNHETYDFKVFYPAMFWESLGLEEKQKYSKLFAPLPLVISVGEIIATHGALPDITNLKEIEDIKTGDKNWRKTTWGDFVSDVNANGEGVYMGTRPELGKKYFDKIMAQINKNVIIRGHDPTAPEKMFNNKCLTVFTSCAYPRKRVVAIADFNKNPNVKSIDDLVIEKI